MLKKVYAKDSTVGTALRPMSVLTALRSICGEFEGWGQKDGQEVILSMIDGLHEAMKTDDELARRRAHLPSNGPQHECVAVVNETSTETNQSIFDGSTAIECLDTQHESEKSSSEAISVVPQPVVPTTTDRSIVSDYLRGTSR